jgi:hypothetical protein
VNTRVACSALLACALVGAPAAEAQNTGWTADHVPTDSLAAPAPFGPGEHLVYRVKMGWFNVGRGSLTVEGLEDVRGNPTYRAAMSLNGRATFYKLDDKYTTWFDTRALQSWRFIRDYKGTYTSFRHYEFYPDRDQWDREDNDEFGPMSTDNPLDDISFMYFLRTLPLNVGDVYTYDRYFREEGNPVSVRVLRKDRRKTDAGEFNTIVVSPTFRSEGLFADGGNAELHFTDDERRILVYMKVDMPGIPGSLTLHLQSIQEGFPLNPESRRVALAARAARQQGGRSNR